MSPSSRRSARMAEYRNRLGETSVLFRFRGRPPFESEVDRRVVAIESASTATVKATSPATAVAPADLRHRHAPMERERESASGVAAATISCVTALSLSREYLRRLRLCRPELLCRVLRAASRANALLCFVERLLWLWTQLVGVVNPYQRRAAQPRFSSERWRS